MIRVGCVARVAAEIVAELRRLGEVILASSHGVIANTLERSEVCGNIVCAKVICRVSGGTGLVVLA